MSPRSEKELIFPIMRPISAGTPDWKSRSSVDRTLNSSATADFTIIAGDEISNSIGFNKRSNENRFRSGSICSNSSDWSYL